MTSSTTRFSPGGLDPIQPKTKRIRIGLLAGTMGCALALQLSPAAAAPTFKLLHSFGNDTDGEGPEADMIAVKGTLYGTTIGGGTNYDGSVFALDRKTGAVTVLYSFCSQQDCADGGLPRASLVNVRGTLYGTTYVGGANNDGTLFSFDPAIGTETTLHTFGGGQDGQRPYAGLVRVNDKLYGTTWYGGASDEGTVFAFDLRTGTESVLYSFCSQQNCADGAWPFANMIDANGMLYGTTYEGGNGGVVFALNPATGAETTLYSFCGQQNCTDGENPGADLIDVNGTLYGTTYNGGAGGGGVVFALDPATGTETVPYSFCAEQNCTDGQNPSGDLIDVNGTLYSTTNGGGADNGGSVFSLDPATGTEQVLYSFCSQANCADGQHPQAGLTDVKGKLYGTTNAGGAYSNNGTAFVLTNP